MPDSDWRDGNVCLGCGDDNPHGLRLRFHRENGTTSTTWIPAPEHQGWAGYAHGGMITLVLDEVMAQSVIECGFLAPTAEIQVRFRQPAPIGQPLLVTSSRPEGNRILTCHGEMRDASGKLIAEATAKFLPGRRLPEK